MVIHTHFSAMQIATIVSQPIPKFPAGSMEQKPQDAEKLHEICEIVEDGNYGWIVHVKEK